MAEPEHQPEHLSDPRVLRALAHPVRGRILDEIEATGPVRAADVARELGIPANQASFHLRQLAKYGLVEEDPAAARDRRDRVWKVVGDDRLVISMGELEEAPGGKAAARVFRAQKSAWAHEVVEAAYSEERPEGAYKTITEQSVRLSKDEAQELAAELDAVLARWEQRTRGRDPSRRTYLLFSMLQPYPGPASGQERGREG
jgi:DNA-binding transcriptional ArsR family regulator